MATKSSSLILARVFTEIRFSPSLLFSDLALLTKYMNLLRNKFETVNYDEKTKQISCSSMGEKRLQADISNNRFVFEFNPEEEAESYKMFQDTVDFMLKEYLKMFEISRLDRAGIRFAWIAEYEIGAAKTLFNDCFLPVLFSAKPPSNVLTGFNSGRVELYFSLPEDVRLNVAIMPAKIQNVTMKIDSTGQHHTQKTLEGIMFDADLFLEGRITVDRYLKQLDEAEKITKARANNILSVMMDPSHGS